MGTIRVAWWNLQNLFDTDDDPISTDLEFTVAKGWTPEAYAAKKANLAAVLGTLTADGPPELLGVAEVEGDDVFAELLDDVGEPNLRVARDPEGTSDLRGIDVSVAYDQRKLTVVAQRTHVVNLRYPTRDIFEVVFSVNDTGDRLVVLASHWPSRRLGRYESEPSRIAVAENVAYLVRNHVRFDAATYLQLRDAGDIDAVRRRWETPILLMGDFNDEPLDRSVVNNLQASSERDRVAGPTNDIDGFATEPAAYTGANTFLYNPMWSFLPGEQSGTFFLDSTTTEAFANRYQVLDQFVVSRGLLTEPGLRLDPASVRIIDDARVATPAKRPRGFDRATKHGTSDHLPITATLSY
ncbi:MAG TPA: endonuclease/exonuclease/phosphatase family protein [Micromonosporaceae bacterium]|jgi:endonuclease/exonuclease/phosphatase family metal-dependent hydrolase